MSAISKSKARPRRDGRSGSRPRTADPRVVRSRAAVIDAARTLFLGQGYEGTTMEDIAALAGLTKRTLYNNYAGKDALFTQIVVDTLAYADEFVRGLEQELAVGITAANLRATLHDVGRRLALGIVRPEVIAIRRLLIGEARRFPGFATDYFDRAPGQVIEALAARFAHLVRLRLLRAPDARRAAAQFAYLVAGEYLDRGVLVGITPTQEHVIACARDGVETFMARYGVTGSGRKRTQ